MNSETNKGNSCFVYNDNRFHKKNGNVCFQCIVKTCKARIETNDAIVAAECGDHYHSDKVSNVAAVALRVSCKRTAAKDISQRTHKKDFLMFYDETVCGEMAIFTTSINLRVHILCLTDTDDIALLKLQVAVLLILHLRFC